MSSATVIRVKRRIDEEPLNAFVLNCKKRRFEDIDASSDNCSTSFNGDGGTEFVAKDTSSHSAASAATAAQTTVVKFAGTVQNQDDIVGQIRKLTRADAIAATNHVRPTSANSSNIRNRHAAQRQHAHEDRFKIVNCFRTLDNHLEDVDVNGVTPASTPSTAGTVPIASASSSGGKLTVVDIEKNNLAHDTPPPSSSSPSGITQDTATISASLADAAAGGVGSGNREQSTSLTDAQPQYVYDLYVPDATAPNAHMDIFIEDLLSIEPLHEHQLDNGDLGASDSDDSEDSNRESNWRNDYPDSDDEENGARAGNGDDDDDSSVNEHVMRLAFDSMDMDAELSSDDDAVVVPNNAFVYTIDQTEEPTMTSMTSSAAATSSSYAIDSSDVDEDDVERYGESYARYKARVLRRAQDKRNSDVDSDDDEDGHSDHMNSSDEHDDCD